MSDGIVVEELVSIIKYEMDAHSKKILEDAEKASKKGVAALNANSKAMKTAEGLAGRLTGAVKGLGIASTLTSGIMAAWSVNSGKEATRLANLSQATQVNIEDLQRLGSVYEQVGGSAKEFANDAAAYFNAYNKKLDVGAMKELARTFSTMAPDMAQQMGRAYGFSDDMIRVLMQGPDKIQAMADKAGKFGHVVEAENIAKLDRMNRSLSNLTGMASGFGMSFRAGLSAGLTPAMDAFTESISSANKSLQEWGTYIGSTFGSVAMGAIGKIETLEKRLSAFNGKQFNENIVSDDAATRRKALDEMKASLGNERIGAIASGAILEQKIRDGLDNARYDYLNALDVNAKKTLGEDVFTKLNEELMAGKWRFPDRVRSSAPTMDELALAEVYGSFDNASYEMDYRNFDHTGQLDAEAFDRRFVRNREHEKATPSTVLQRPSYRKDAIRAGAELMSAFDGRELLSPGGGATSAPTASIGVQNQTNHFYINGGGDPNAAASGVVESMKTLYPNGTD